MRLARLTLNGFKSFDDRTEFAFDDPVTGIVGPNGCGKSNVVDAIKWVLGERSSKSLRGKEMLDVVFAGSAGRKPAGMASVTLTFENPPLPQQGEEDAAQRDEPRAGGDAPEAEPALPDDAAEASAEEAADAGSIVGDRRAIGRALPIDEDVVEVERRLYRDGQSQYRINGRRCRLRDIRELFLDTGVGADAYSIIEQGRVDAMLLANPSERRGIFEEAAGVARYRQRRVEASRKLDRAERNLAVTREQLASTERRLRIVRGQAQRARRFLELDTELRAWRAARALAQHDALATEHEALTEQMGKARDERDRADGRLRSLEADRQHAEIERQEAADALRAAEGELDAARRALESASATRDSAGAAAADAHARAQADQRRVEELDAEAADLERRRERSSSAVARAAEALADAERELGELVDRRQALHEALSGHRQRHDEARRTVEGIERDRVAIQGRAQEEARRAEQLASRADQHRAELASLEEQADQARAELAQAQSASRDLDARAADQQSQAERLERKAADLGADRAQQASAVRELEERGLRLSTRRHTLEELLASREGLGEAARDVLDRAQRGEGFAGVLAPLTELVRVPYELAPQVEAALGPLLGAIVVRAPEAMPQGDELASLGGRVGFVPLAPAREGGATDTDTQPPAGRAAHGALVRSGRLVSLREAVTADDEGCRRAGVPAAAVQALLDGLLAHCWRTTGMDAASLLAAGPMRGGTFVDDAATVLAPTGAVFAGPLAADDGLGQAAGVLQRRAELEGLLADQAKTQRQLDRAAAGLASLDREAADLNDRAADARRALHELSSQRVRAQGDADRAQDRAASLEGRIAREREQLEAADRARASAADEADALAARLTALDSVLAGERASVEELGKALADAEAAAADAAEALTASRVRVGTLGEQLTAARREAQALGEQADRLASQRRELAANLQRATDAAREHESAAEAARRSIASATGDRDAAAGRADAARGSLHAAQERALSLEKRLNAARSDAADVDRRWHALELRNRELEVRLENLVRHAKDEQGLDLPAERAGYRDALADGMRAVGEREADEAIAQLRGQIDKLGSVNLAAVDEEGQLEGRNEALAGQVEDIDATRRQLTELIARLDEASRRRFTEMLETIRSSFAGEDGLFRRLFGGGRAEIRLLPIVREVDGQKVQTDEVDPLESGIEIVARPPGKQPRSISQLSGGEKAMTAVALLLAIFRSKPSCFCVLDEVDAALDDANVDRFCRVVREFSQTSNFIVITHHKKTMAMCDRLHGVTMQQRGVSTRVGVRFDQVGPDGRLSAAAVDSSAGDTQADTQKDNAAPPDGPARSGEPEPEGSQPKNTPGLRNALANMRNGRETESQAEQPAAQPAELAEANA